MLAVLLLLLPTVVCVVQPLSTILQPVIYLVEHYAALSSQPRTNSRYLARSGAVCSTVDLDPCLVRTGLTPQNTSQLSLAAFLVPVISTCVAYSCCTLQPQTSAPKSSPKPQAQSITPMFGRIEKTTIHPKRPHKALHAGRNTSQQDRHSTCCFESISCKLRLSLVVRSDITLPDIHVCSLTSLYLMFMFAGQQQQLWCCRQCRQ